MIQIYLMLCALATALPCRAVTSDRNVQDYQYGVFGFDRGDAERKPTLFAGTGMELAQPNQQFGLIGISLSDDRSMVELNHRVFEKVAVNGEVQAANPLLGQSINKMTLLGQYPVVAVMNNDLFKADLFIVDTRQARLIDVNIGTLTNPVGGIGALAATDKTVVAAVYGDGQGFFSGGNRALVKWQPDVTNFSDRPAWASVGVDFGFKRFDIAKTGKTFVIVESVNKDDYDLIHEMLTLSDPVLHWNPYLKKMYIGCDRVSVQLYNDQEGVMALGLIDNVDHDTNNLQVKSVVDDLTMGLLFKDNLQGSMNVGNLIVGYAFDRHINTDPQALNAKHDIASTVPYELSIGKIASMRTSTGRDYLIVWSKASIHELRDNESVAEGTFYSDLDPRRDYTGIFALPLTPDGVIANIHNATVPADVPADDIENMPKANDPRFRVGDPIVAPYVGADPRDANLTRWSSEPSPITFWQKTSDRTTDGYAQVLDLMVEGDTVFVTVGVKQDGKILLMGTFKSTALFDAAGALAGWTVWEPVARVSVDKDLKSMFPRLHGYDPKTGSWYGLKTIVPNGGTVSVYPWISTWEADEELLEDFSQNLGGVYRAVPMGPATPSFLGGALIDQRTFGLDPETVFPRGDQMAVTALVGFDTILLQQSFLDDVAVAIDGWKLEGSDATDPLNYKLFDEDEALQMIAPLSTVAASGYLEQARTIVPRGFLFAGGHHGLAVLLKQNGVYRVGWDVAFSNNASKNDELVDDRLKDLSTTLKDFEFYEVELRVDFQPVIPERIRAIIPQAQFVLVVTDAKIYVVDVTQNFAQKPDEPRTVTIDAREYLLPDPVKSGDATITDAIIADNQVVVVRKGLLQSEQRNLFVLATTKGLWATVGGDQAAPQNAKWEEIEVNGTKELPIVQLVYLSNRRKGAGEIGNLYVLAADRALVPSEGAVYRYAINAQDGESATDRIKFFGLPADLGQPKGRFFDFKEFRGQLYTDGAVLLHARGKHFGDTQFVDNVLVADRTKNNHMTQYLGLSGVDNYNVGQPTFHPGTGAMLVPGDWGLIVNK